MEPSFIITVIVIGIILCVSVWLATCSNRTPPPQHYYTAPNTTRPVGTFIPVDDSNDFEEELIDAMFEEEEYINDDPEVQQIVRDVERRMGHTQIADLDNNDNSTDTNKE